MHRKVSQHWWTRPCGGREVLALALPLMISTFSTTLMTFTDRMFLLWYSKEAVAAALPAGVCLFSLVCLPLGIASYVNTFVAQYQGAGRPRRIGPIVWQGLWVGILTTPLWLAAIPLAPLLFQGHDPKVAALETSYFRILSLGAGAMVLAAAQSAFFTGRGATRVVMVVDMGAALLNAGLDYLWIFGILGFPEGGIEGAAWATIAAEWVRVAVYAAIMLRPVYRRTYQLAAGWRLDRRLMLRLCRFGGPGGLHWFMECTSFAVFIVLVGRLGVLELAATNLAFNINSVAWVPMLGLGIAVSTLVGQQLGRNQPDLAARGTWTALVIALIYMGGMSLLYVLAPDLFLFGHAAGTSPEEFGPLREIVVVLLRFVAAYCLFDALNMVFVSAIRGAGDMRFVLCTTLATSPMPLLGAWWGITFQGWGLLWCWIVITVWVCSLGLIYLARFLQGRWRHMRVIEPELLPETVAGQGEPELVTSV